MTRSMQFVRGRDSFQGKMAAHLPLPRRHDGICDRLSGRTINPQLAGNRTSRPLAQGERLSAVERVLGVGSDKPRIGIAINLVCDARFENTGPRRNK